MLVAAVATALLVGVTAPMASAQVVGPVTIKGRLYLDGELSKVNCTGDDGNTLDVGTYGVRVFTIASTCVLWLDTGNADEFRFVGQEETISVNGDAKRTFIFSGTEQGTGPTFGAAHSEEKFVDAVEAVVPTTEKGSMTYSYVDNDGVSVVFVGDFKAKF